VPNWGLVPTLIAAGREGDPGGGGEVGGGDAEQGAAAAVADHHLALDGERAAEGGGRGLHVAGGQLGPDPGRGDDLAGLGVQGDGDDLDPAGAAEVGQQGRVAGRLVAEAEVLPHHHGPGGQPVEQHLGGEVLGADLGQLLGELEHEHDRHAGLAEQLDLAVQGGEQGRLAARAEHGQGVAVEGDGRRRHPALGRLGRHPVQQRPVPAVDAVEHPHRDHRAVEPGGQGGQPVEAPHPGRRARPGRPAHWLTLGGAASMKEWLG
jgi:hypothetical protein